MNTSSQRSHLFDLLAEDLANDVISSLEAGIKAGAVFEQDGGPGEQVRQAVGRAGRAIEDKDRDGLLERFLTIGPYWDGGPIPPDCNCQSDEEVAEVVRLIFSSVISTFQGELAEMLAIAPVVAFSHQLAATTGANTPPRVFIGDTVFAHPPGKSTWAKTADFHVLDTAVGTDPKKPVTVHGVVEVKSFIATASSLQPQVEQHLARAQQGLRIQGTVFSPDQIALGTGSDGPAQIMVVPDSWKLPRAYQFVDRNGGTLFEVEEPAPAATTDRISQLGPNRWLVTLRWSGEILAEAAYDLAYWYLGQLGSRLVGSDGEADDWPEDDMDPVEAGQNAAKQALYYAILRLDKGKDATRGGEQTLASATALFNCFSFGYPVGSSFVDSAGRREMLFFQDLREIYEGGQTSRKPTGRSTRWRIRGFEPEKRRD